jgi:hypothetical protein
MPEQDADVFEILIGQMAERRDTDPIFGKALRVLQHAELFKPVRNLLPFTTVIGGSFGRNVALHLQRLAGSRLSWVAAYTGTPLHGR